MEGWASAKALSFWGLTGKAIEDGDLINWQNGALWTRLSPTDSGASPPPPRRPPSSRRLAATRASRSLFDGESGRRGAAGGAGGGGGGRHRGGADVGRRGGGVEAAPPSPRAATPSVVSNGPAELSDGEAPSLAGAPAHEQLGQMLGVSMTTLAVWVWGVIGLLLVLGGAVALSLRRELGAGGGGGGHRRPSRVLSPFGAHRGMSRLSTKDDDEDDGSPPRNGPGWDESPRRSEVGDNYTCDRSAYNALILTRA